MLLFGGVLLIGVAVDVTRLIATWRETAHLAATAAETGAGWVQSEDLYLGELILDPDAAERAAHEVAGADDRAVDVTVTPSEVCVTVEQEVSPGVASLVGIGSKVVMATACASPRQG